MKYIINILIALISSVAISQEFHVATSGSDGYPGTMSQPWQSIQHAMDNATPGSTVHIHGGLYNERVYVNVDGTPDNYITFIAHNEEEVVLDGSGLTDYALIEMYDVQYVAIEGLKIRNNIQPDAVGILIEGACNNIRIEDCDISNIHFSSDPNAEVTEETNAQALIVYGTEGDHAITDLELIDNEIFDCRLGYSEALAVNGNVNGFLISENEIHDVTNIGIDVIGHEGTCWEPSLDQARNGVITDNEVFNCLSPYATAAGIYVDGGKDLVIERNHVHHNQWGIEIGCENIGKSTQNVFVRNNFIYRNSSAGLHIGGYDYPSGSGKVENSFIINNSFFGNDTDNDWTGELYLSYNEGLILRNNIFYADNTNGVMMSDEELSEASTGINFTRNCWYHPLGDGNVEWVFAGTYYNTLSDFQATGISSASFVEDPRFVSTSSEPDLHLTANSSVNIVNYGSTTYYGDYDIDGENRVDGSGIVDLGADEYNSSVGLLDFSSSTFSIFPNPTQDYIHFEESVLNDLESIVIFDYSGKLVQVERVLDSSINWIDVSYLQTGIYVIQMNYESGKLASSDFMKMN